MNRDEFRLHMNNYKKARESNPSLSYWLWKANKYAEGTDEITNTTLPEVVVTPRRNYVNYPIDLDAYNSAMLDAWGKQTRIGPEDVVDYVPVIGDIKGVYDIAKDFANKEYLAGATGLGLALLPNVIEKPLRRLLKHRKTLKKLSIEDVKDWSDAQWDNAYFQAIKDGKLDEVQRIRDLHFVSKVPNNGLTVVNDEPVVWYHGTPYAGHSVFNSLVFNNTIGGTSANGRIKGNFFTTDLNAAKNYATRPSEKIDYPYYSKPKNIKQKLLNVIGKYKPEKIHGVDRVPDELKLDVTNMHTHQVPVIKLTDNDYTRDKVYSAYINPLKTYVVDFKGLPWSNSPTDFPSKYYTIEEYLEPRTENSISYLDHVFKQSEPTNDLLRLKQEIESIPSPSNNIMYNGRGEESLLSKRINFKDDITPENILQTYPNYKERPGYQIGLFEYRYPNTTNGAVQYGASEGYDTIYMPNVVDANTGRFENYPINDIVPINSNLIKLANPITYDKNGVIPISKRDNFANSDIRYGLIPILGFSSYNLYKTTKNQDEATDDNNIKRYANGTDGIVDELKSNTRTTLTPEEQQYLLNKSKQRQRMSGAITPVFDIQDAVDFTPIGDVLTARDAYNAALDRDYIKASAMLGLMLAPPALGRIAKETIPSFVTAAADKINELRRRERRNKELDTKIFSQGIEDRNRIIEELYDTPGIWDRAYNADITYGTNYVDTYDNLINNYYSNYFNLPEPIRKDIGEALGLMSAKPEAIRRYNDEGIPAGWSDFAYYVNPSVENLDKALTRHEMGHYVDFNMSKSGNADRGNLMFDELKKDLSIDPNPTMPNRTDYFRKGTELKSYMNTLRLFMFDNNMINRIDDLVTLKQIKEAINKLPSELKSVKAAYQQFKSPRKYTKWFNTIPLLGSIPFIYNYSQEKDSN